MWGVPYPITERNDVDAAASTSGHNNNNNAHSGNNGKRNVQQNVEQLGGHQLNPALTDDGRSMSSPFTGDQESIDDQDRRHDGDACSARGSVGESMHEDNTGGAGAGKTDKITMEEDLHHDARQGPFGCVDQMDKAAWRVQEGQERDASVSHRPARTSMMDKGPPFEWKVEQVVEWIQSKGFGEDVCSKFAEHGISGRALLEFDVNMLKGINIIAFGKRMKIADAINELPRPPSFTPSDTAAAIGHITSNGKSLALSPIATALGQGGVIPVVPGEDGRVLLSDKRGDVITAHSTVIHDPLDILDILYRPSERQIPRLDTQTGKISFKGRKPAQVSVPTQPSTPGAVLGAITLRPGENAIEQLKEIVGVPDHSGFMLKKGGRYNTWKRRFFFLSGSHLYYLRDKAGARIKGYINIRGYKVIADEAIHPGRYGFRIVMGTQKPHFFSSEDQRTIRGWVRALMKATIDRDFAIVIPGGSSQPNSGFRGGGYASVSYPPPVGNESDAAAGPLGHNNNKNNAHSRNAGKGNTQQNVSHAMAATVAEVPRAIAQLDVHHSNSALIDDGRGMSSVPTQDDRESIGDQDRGHKGNTRSSRGGTFEDPKGGAGGSKRDKATTNEDWYRNDPQSLFEPVDQMDEAAGRAQEGKGRGRREYHRPAGTTKTKKKPPSEWNVEQVVDWVRSKGFDESVCIKFAEHEITGDVLLRFDLLMLKEIDILAFGKRMRIANAIRDLLRPSSFSSSDGESSNTQGRGLNQSTVTHSQLTSSPRVRDAQEEAKKGRAQHEEEQEKDRTNKREKEKDRARMEAEAKKEARLAELEAKRLEGDARLIADAQRKAQEEEARHFTTTTAAVASPPSAIDRLAGNAVIEEDMSSNTTARHRPYTSGQSLLPINQLSDPLEGYPRVDVASLQLSYEELPQSARNFFHFISSFHHTGILVGVLVTAAANDFKDGFQLSLRPGEQIAVVADLEKLLRTGRKWNEVEVQSSIENLQSLSLISSVSKDNQVFIQMDPLIQAWCRNKDPLASRHYLSMALQVVTCCSGKDAFPLHQHLVPHIIGILDQIKAEDLHLNDLMAAGAVLEAQEYHQQAEELFRAALKLMRNTSVQNSRATIVVHRWLGIPSIDEGRQCEPEALQTEYLEAAGLGAMTFSPNLSTLAATAYTVLQSVCGLHKIALLCIKHLDGESNMSTIKIKLDSDPSWTRLAYHPTGKYICWGEHAWDLALEPPTRVPEPKLSVILQEAFHHGALRLPPESSGSDPTQILHFSPNDNVLVYTADNGLLALAAHNSQVTVLNVEHVLTADEIALINRVRNLEHHRDSRSDAGSGKETQEARSPSQ